MAGFDRFNTIWANAGVIIPPTTPQYDAGFAFLGPTPPSVELFNAMFQEQDEKDNWLFNQIAAVIGTPPTDVPDTQLRDAINDMVSGGVGGYVLKAGDTMTGPLVTTLLTANDGVIAGTNGVNYSTLGANYIGYQWDDPNAAMNAYVDGVFVGSFFSGNYNDAKYVLKTGDVMTGPLQSMAFNSIGNGSWGTSEISIGATTLDRWQLTTDGAGNFYIQRIVAGSVFAQNQFTFAVDGSMNSPWNIYAANDINSGNQISAVTAISAGTTINSGARITSNTDILATTSVYANGGGMMMGPLAGVGAIFQYSPSWYWDWNSTNGDLRWIGSGGAYLTFAGAGPVTVASDLNVGNSLVVAEDIIFSTVTNPGRCSLFGSGDLGTLILNVSGGGECAMRAYQSLGETQITANGIISLRMVNNGDAYFIGNVFGAAFNPSDSRVKMDQIDYVCGLNEIIQMQPKMYKFMNDPEGPDHASVDAQDLEAIISNAVIIRDNTRSGGLEDQKFIQSDFVLYAAVNAIKELNARITAGGL